MNSLKKQKKYLKKVKSAMKKESDKLEFKREINDSLIKEVIAFMDEHNIK